MKSPPETADPYRTKGVTLRRYNPGFELVRGANKKYFRAGREPFDFIGDRKSREQMASGTAAGENNAKRCHISRPFRDSARRRLPSRLRASAGPSAADPLVLKYATGTRRCTR